MKRRNTLFKTFLCSVILAIGLTIVGKGSASTNVQVVVSSIGDPVSSIPAGPFVPATTAYLAGWQQPQPDGGLAEYAHIAGAHWIWMDNFIGDINHPLYFSKTLSIPEGASDITGTIQITADNFFNFSINGADYGGTGPPDTEQWSMIYTFSIANLSPGENHLFITVWEAHPGTPSGLVYSLTVSYNLQGEIQLPRTGQTTSYYPGDDGDIQAGVPWSDPRFTDNGDGTVTDNLTGLMWTKDAGTSTVGACTGAIKDWHGALDYVACLNNDNYLGHSDWRLPNINELYSLIDRSRYGPALPESYPFTNVQSEWYWSSTTYAGLISDVWDVAIGFSGGVSYVPKGSRRYAWPVRGGECGLDSSAICLSKTGQTISYAAEDDGAIQTGIPWPNPRFTDNGDGTITDNLTGMIWTKRADTPSVSSCAGGMKNWQSALDYVACLNNSNYLGYTDWRLPNINELYSLVDRSRYGPALPEGYPFTNVPLNQYYCSSTTIAGQTDSAWYLDIKVAGSVSGVLKINDFYVWPVRGGTISTPIDTTPPATTASPSGGTYISAQSVTLTCSDGSGYGCDKIYYTTDGSTPTTGSPVYSSPINISVSAILKFFATDLAGNRENVKTEIYTIGPASGVVTLIIPNGGDVLPSGGTYAICWNAPSDAVKFDLKYTTGGGNWIAIKTVPGLHCTNWGIPVLTGNKKKCRVKVTGYDSNAALVGEDISDKPFVIEVLRITSPNGGETLTSGDTKTIQWTTHKTIRPVAKTVLKYTTDGTTWKKIKTFTGDPGSYDWTVPNVSSTKCKVKIILKDASGAEVGNDTSDKVFTIHP